MRRHDIRLLMPLTLLLALTLCTTAVAALDPPIWPATEDFESYAVGDTIKSKAGWDSSDVYYTKGWIVTDDGADTVHGKYIRFWPSPFKLASLTSNYATWHTRAPYEITELTLVMDYLIQTYGDLKVSVSGDNNTWVDVTATLDLVKVSSGLFRRTTADLTSFIGDANVTTDVYVKFQAAISSGAYWVSAVDYIGLETKGQRPTRATGPTIPLVSPDGTHRDIAEREASRLSSVR